MGVFYLIVNPAKKEYLDPYRFGQGAKFVNLLGGGPLTFAVKQLIADSGPGWWVGDPIILAADDIGPPNPGRLVTNTPTIPHRNLNAQAREEFTDISYRVLALIGHSPEITAELAKMAVRKSDLLLDLGVVIEEYGIRPLEIALERVVGRPWRKAHNKAAAESPSWRPLPRIGWGLYAEIMGATEPNP
jgi:hypothetical protein